MQPSGSHPYNRPQRPRAILSEYHPATPETGRDSTPRKAERRKKKERGKQWIVQNAVLFARIRKFLRVVDILDVRSALSA